MNFRAFEIGKYYRDFKGMNGAKLYLQDGRLFLVISYDDMQDEEIKAFRQASFEVVFKTLGMISLFTFKFHEYIVDAPFNQFEENCRWNCDPSKEGVEIPLIIFAFESSTGELLVKREEVLTTEFCTRFTEVVSEQRAECADRYNLKTFNAGIRKIYDNHIVEELYELPGDREIRCLV